jgi:urea transporter
MCMYMCMYMHMLHAHTCAGTGALAEPLPAAAWALQGGAVALVEAWTLQKSTESMIRRDLVRRDPPRSRFA